MIVQEVVVGPLQVNCFIVGCEATKEALVVDPGEDGERILKAVAALGLKVTAIINTHGHFDHVGANPLLIEQTKAPLSIHVSDAALLPRAREHAAKYGLQCRVSPPPDRVLHGGETLKIGELVAKVIHTPGHTPGGITLYIGEHLFCGDTLFADSVGRTDLPGGDHDQLVASIRERLFVLPDSTIVHPGHGPDTTIGREKRLNPFVGEGR